MNRRCWLVAWGALLGPAMLGACGSASADSADAPAEVVVFAAASLSEVFEDLGDSFAAAHPDDTVVFNFGASSRLATQIIEGAPADVFASADLANIDRLTERGMVGESTVFALNRAAIAVEMGNPLDIAGLADLDGVLFVACAEEVPCGSYTSQILGRAGVEADPASYEANVKSVVTKVALGEADAGIVYATDIRAGAGVDGVEIPVAANVVAEYPIAVVTGTAAPDGAQRFVDFVSGATGRAILAGHGFGAP